MICEQTPQVDIRHLVNLGVEPTELFNPVSGEVEQISTEMTACHFGGHRTWFTCPSCNRRCAILYARSVIACRKCHGLTYAIERKSVADRAIDSALKFRERFGQIDRGLLDQFPPKPKHMHWRTYLKARQTDKCALEAIYSAEAKRLGLPQRSNQSAH